MDIARLLSKDFDESAYLNENPDVSTAVKWGAFASGLEHCISYGLNEDRPGIPQSIKELLLQSDPVTPPPEHLRKRVHGDESPVSFDSAGRLLAYNLYSTIQSIGGLKPNSRVLDFGCGCGRVINHLSRYFKQSIFHGADIDAEAVSWCRDELHHVREFVTNEVLPPLPFADGYFDMVYSISVFTHLPEDMQFAWLEELKRVTKPNGILLLTIHGEELFAKAPDNFRTQLAENGFFYTIGNGTEGLPEFYQTTYHTYAYILEKWSRYFAVQEILKKGIMCHQDLVICINTGGTVTPPAPSSPQG
ncbi:MAG: class I SAM-dependent methyltransferase [Candidatus Thiodiazotropha sp.]